MRWIAIGLIVIGALLALASLFADSLGIGAAGGGFGWKQVIGTLIGAGLCFGGARGWWDIARGRKRTTRNE